MTTTIDDNDENFIPLWMGRMGKRSPSKKLFEKLCNEKLDIPPVKKRRLTFGEEARQQKKGDDRVVVRRLTFGEDDEKTRQQKKGDDRVVVIPSWLRKGDKWWDGCFVEDSNNSCSSSSSKHNSAFRSFIPTNSDPSFYTFPFNKQSPPPPPAPPAPTRTTEIKKYEKNFCRDCENVFYCKDNNYNLYQKLYDCECKMWK